MIEWPDKLILDIGRRNAVIFIGAGVSKNSVGSNNRRPPDWEEFLRKGIDKCGKPKQHLQSLMKKGDYLTACEIVKDRLREGFSDLLREEFVEPRYKAADIHKYLFNLDVRLVLTQNFDKIYDTFAQAESQNTVAIKNYTDTDIASIIREDVRAVVKVHGTIDNTTQMIFTRAEYAKARNRYVSFYSILDALALTHTFLFLGCGLSDPDIRILLERQAYSYGTARPHYIAMPKSRSDHQEYVNSIESNLNLRILRYNPRNNHTELTESLRTLVDLVDQKRLELAQNMDW